jgi:hypothetical protein
MQVLSEGAGTAFDAEVVAGFLHMLGEYPPGALFRVRSGEVVVVTVGGEEARGLVVRDREGRRVSQPEPVLLREHEVLGPVLAEDAGVDPSALLEAAGG